MDSPFRLEGPANVSFSGGRTSAYMLRRILDAGPGANVHVLFCNTGKERDETLDFVRECGERWGVKVHWLEFDLMEGQAITREVTYATASRRGEPFERLIGWRGLPNAVYPFCSTELKARVIKRWMQARDYDGWVSAVGLRADERARVARMRDRQIEGGWVELPLATAGVTLADVDAFWSVQPFRLQLKSYEGNCDLCWKKGRLKIDRVMREHPELAAWWIEQERATGSRFRVDRPSYAGLADVARRQLSLPIVDDWESMSCGCTD